MLWILIHTALLLCYYHCFIVVFLNNIGGRGILTAKTIVRVEIWRESMINCVSHFWSKLSASREGLTEVLSVFTDTMVENPCLILRLNLNWLWLRDRVLVMSIILHLSEEHNRIKWATIIELIPFLSFNQFLRVVPLAGVRIGFIVVEIFIFIPDLFLLRSIEGLVWGEFVDGELTALADDLQSAIGHNPLFIFNPHVVQLVLASLNSQINISHAHIITESTFLLE